MGKFRVTDEAQRQSFAAAGESVRLREELFKAQAKIKELEAAIEEIKKPKEKAKEQPAKK
jgi:hypothetical protein